MKSKVRHVYFFRHGEEINDVERRFGGWSDPDITKKGRELAKKKALKFKKRKMVFDIILTSPLKRALNTAKIIGKILNLKVEEFIYLKERNTYGILCGLTKDKAKNQYPELTRLYNAQQYIPGSERYDDFKDRVELLLDKLIQSKYQSVLCVTHGYLITTLMEEFLGLNREKIDDGSMLGLKIVNNKFEYFMSEGLTFTEGKPTYDSKRYRKFKR